MPAQPTVAPDSTAAASVAMSTATANLDSAAVAVGPAAETAAEQANPGETSTEQIHTAPTSRRIAPMMRMRLAMFMGRPRRPALAIPHRLVMHTPRNSVHPLVSARRATHIEKV
jgi:hypothetical protein